MELEEPQTPFKPVPDRRPDMPEPPPVQVVAIADISLLATTGMEHDLDAFYVGVFRFERGSDTDRVIYLAENVAIRFRFVEGLVRRDDFVPTGLLVPSLPALRQRLVDQEILFERQQGIQSGMESVVLQDPAGNWLSVSEFRRVG